MLKSIKQQYIDLREGNMSQANFMRNLRMTMSHLVTNVTSFDDSIKILKNKGILTEADISVIKINKREEEIDDIENNKEESEEIETLTGTSTNGITSDNDQYHRDGYTMGYFEESLNETISDEDIMKKYNEMFGKNPQTKFADVAKALNIPEDQVSAALQTGSMPKFGLREAKDEKGKWTNTSGKSMYDQFREIDNLNGQEILIGIDYEIEKNKELTKKEAAKIVIKNLKKNSIYYTATLMSGVEGYEPEYIGGKSANPEAHQMQYLDKNMSNVVDKKRGMQPVKGIEKPKKDSDARSEINKIIKGVEELTHAAKRAKGIKGVFDMTGGKMKKVSVKESLNDNLRSLIKEIIRKELKETFDGRDNMTDMFGHQMDEVDIYGIAGNPEEEMAAKLAKDPNKYTKFEPVDKVGMRDIELDNMLEDAENNIDWLVKQVGDDAELGAALISRARKTRPSLVSGLKQALNLYNY